MAAQTTEHGGLATRYAAALYELADSKKALDAVAGDLTALRKMIDESGDLRRMMNSSCGGLDAQAKGLAAVVKAAGFSELTQKFAGLVAQNRRLFTLPAMIRAFLKLLADRRGETTAQVTAARPLTAEQQAAVAEAIKKEVGSKV